MKTHLKFVALAAMFVMALSTSACERRSATEELGADIKEGTRDAKRGVQDALD